MEYIMKAFENHKILCGGMFSFFGISLLMRLFLGVLYTGMLKETDNMAATKNKLLKQCKTKFVSCCQLNGGVKNVSVFVDKFLNRLCLGPISFGSMYHFSGQAMLLSVVFGGLAICISIAQGAMFGAVLPYFTTLCLELYLFFSVSAAVDLNACKAKLKVNLVDYLENHLQSRMKMTGEDMDAVYGKKSVELLPVGNRNGKRQFVAEERRDREQDKSLQGNVTEEELEALLKEFLA